MDRLVVGADAQITSDTFTTIDGETPVVLGSPPIVSVTNAIGTVLTAPIATADPANPGRYLVTLTAATHLTQPDRLTVTWTSGTQSKSQIVEVAAGRYCSITDVRDVPHLASAGEFTTARIRRAITEFEDLVDEYRGISFVRRVAVTTHRLDYGKDYVALNRAAIYAIRQLTGPQGVLTAAGWLWDGAGHITVNAGAAGVPAPAVANSDWDVTVVWEHGLTRGDPELLRRAAVEYVRATLLKEVSGTSRDVIATAADGFVTRYSTPDWGMGRPTGMLEVDRLLNQLVDRRLPGVA